MMTIVEGPTLAEQQTVTNLKALHPMLVSFGGRECFDALAPRWRQLCSDVNAGPFLTPEWVRCYVEGFERSAEAVVITVSKGDCLLAVLPLIRKWTWFRGIRLLELRGAANAHSVSFDVLTCTGVDGEQAVRTIWRGIRQIPGWHVLHLPYCPHDGASTQLLECADRDGFATLADPCADNPVLRMRAGTDGKLDPYTATDSRFRRELRRSFHRLQADIGVKPEVVRRTCVDRSLARFYELEASGWKGRKGTAIQCSSDTRSYYEEISRVADEQNTFVLHSLEADGRMLAACLGLEVRDRYFGLKMAYDENLRSCGLGHLVLSSVLEDCADHGIATVYLGGKLDSYKKRWTTNTAPQVNRFVFNTGLLPQIVFYERTRLFPALRRTQKWIGRRLRPASSKMRDS